MEISLSIDDSTCIRCTRCVRVCPSGIFFREEGSAAQNPAPEAPGVESPGYKFHIGIRNVSYCIVCGHCVAVCPTSSVIHNHFPESTVHKIDSSRLPSPESVMLLCRSRRSNRGFNRKPVPEDKLAQIVEAAHRAPTASNAQQVEFTLITDPVTLGTVVEYTMNGIASLVGKLNNPFLKPVAKLIAGKEYLKVKRMGRLLKEYAKGNDPILRNATALLLIHTPADSRFGRDDANLAYQNGSLMAESLGVAQFYTGYVCNAVRRDKKRRLEKSLGIDGTIHAGMALGMPDFTYPNYIDRKPVRLRRIG